MFKKGTSTNCPQKNIWNQTKFASSSADSPSSPNRARLSWMVDVAGENCLGGASSGWASQVGMGSQVDDATAPVFHDDMGRWLYAVGSHWRWLLIGRAQVQIILKTRRAPSTRWGQQLKQQHHQAHPLHHHSHITAATRARHQQQHPQKQGC